MRICIAGISQDLLALALVLREYGQHSIVGFDHTAHSEAVQLGECDDREVRERLVYWPIPYTNQPRVAIREGADLVFMAGTPDTCIRLLAAVTRTDWRGPVVAIDPLPRKWLSGWPFLEVLRPHYTVVGHAPFHYARDPIGRLTSLRRIVVDTKVPAVRDAVSKAWAPVDNKIPISPPGTSS